MLEVLVWFVEGVSGVHKIKGIAIILAFLILVTPVVFAQNYIEVWPEGWSEISPFFTTSIFAERFFVTHDSAGINFLSVDGVYFKELDLTYRLIENNRLHEEIVLCSEAEIDSTYFSLDQSGGRHVLWLERGTDGNKISYTSFSLPFNGHEPTVLIETDRTIQDLNAFQIDETIHVVWAEREEYFQIRYLQVIDGKVDFVETVTDSQNISIKPSIIVDSKGDGDVHLAWLETSEMGVEIKYNKRTKDGWSNAQKVGDGSAQDIQQGGGLSMGVYADGVYLAWSAQQRNSSRLAVFMTKVDGDGNIATPTSSVMGNRARFVEGTENPEIIWQGTGIFGSQINYLGSDRGVTNLTVGRKGAFRPEAYDRNGFRYAYWLQAEADGSYQVYGINNEYPRAMSLWRKIGLDEKAPLYHVLFLFMSTIMVAAVYTVLNLAVIVVVIVIHILLQKIEVYQKQGLFYQIALVGTLLMVVRRLPIPSGSAEFFGLIHYGLSYSLATLGTFLILRKVRQRGLFFTIGITIVWMLLYNFFALIPQTILH